MGTEELRLECLRLAAQTADGNSPPADVAHRARVYFDFIAGTSDAEIVRAAHALARKVTG